MIDRRKFFDATRTNPFAGKFTAGQVAGCEAILKAWEESGLTDLRWLAYMLATSFHETARTMQPITEYGKKSYFNKYEPSTKIGKVLGNTVPGDGWKFRGRGYVQLTGRANYKKAASNLGFDLIVTPDIALRPDIAARIMFKGMTEGWFTVKKLGDYLYGTVTDWVNARRIINGTDKASTIAGYARSFFVAVEAAYVASAPNPPVIEPAEPVQPVPPPPSPPDAPRPRPEPTPFPVEPVGFWAGLWRAIAGWFG